MEYIQHKLILEVSIVLFFIYLLVRIIKVVKNIRMNKPTKVKRKNIRTLIVLGSGGHTGELLKIISQLDFHKYYPRIYVTAINDVMSCSKASLLENEQANDILFSESKEFQIINIPRSREVGQSYVTSIYTTALSAFKSFSVLISFQPDLILCNGPGNCVPICILGFIFNILGIMQPRIIFIESICRVKSLSLSGKLLYHICNDFFVQWLHLQKDYPRAQYLGRLF